MNRLVLVAAFAASSILASGCAANPTLLQRAEDTDALAEAIARRGQGEGPPGPETNTEPTTTDKLMRACLIGCIVGPPLAIAGAALIALKVVGSKAPTPARAGGSGFAE